MSAEKAVFLSSLRSFADGLKVYVSSADAAWSIKGFIDTGRRVYSISSDSKIVSKVIEIQLYPKFMEFADEAGFEMILADKQNWYPDMSFVKKTDPTIKFAVDIKSSFRLEGNEDFCSGFTLGSHCEYFRDRYSTKNIQFPYADYLAHVSFGVIYTRNTAEETTVVSIDRLDSVESVIKDLLFFVQEKWKIASDRSGSGNTANIGSITYIPDLLLGRGVFSDLGEGIFDEYWINRGILVVPDPSNPGKEKKLTRLEELLRSKGISADLINKPRSKRSGK